MTTNAHRILQQHLTTDLLLGVDHVITSSPAPSDQTGPAQTASTAFESAPAQRIASAPPGTAARPASAQTSTSNPRPTAFQPVHMPLPHPRPTAPSAAGLFGGPVQPRAPLATGLPDAPDSHLPATQPLSREKKISLLTEMNDNEVRVCTKCKLCTDRTNTVFGEGDVDAKLMFIGEGPGEDEDLTGRPFVGRAGQKLTEMITAGMKLDRGSVYITNTVKCRPPGNRAPEPDEINHCSDYLIRQIQTVQPRVIVALGASATKTLLQSNHSITSIRGVWHYLDIANPQGKAIPVMPTFHPAYLLRAYTPENRRKVWEDLKKTLSWLDELTPRT